MDNAAWQTDPLLSLTGAISDPRGAPRARGDLRNSGGAEQTVGQTLASPGEYQYCLSAYVRAATATSVRLVIGSQAIRRPVTTEWTRIAWTSSGDAQATSVRFAIEIGAGDVVDVYGLQVEAQTAASGYKDEHTGRRLRRRAPGRRCAGDYDHRRESPFLHGKDHSCKPSLNSRSRPSRTRRCCCSTAHCPTDGRNTGVRTE